MALCGGGARAWPGLLRHPAHLWGRQNRADGRGGGWCAGAGGAVTGIIPDFLRAREVAHAGVTDLLVTDSMHSRKALMFEHADAFVTMPGGLGTLDETAEIITWRQLGLHDRPILIANINGWAAPLIATLNAYISDGFADPTSRALFEVLPDTSAVLRSPADPPRANPHTERTTVACGPAYRPLYGALGRSVAQPGRALASGARGRRFESSRSDQFSAWRRPSVGRSRRRRRAGPAGAAQP